MTKLIASDESLRAAASHEMCGHRPQPLQPEA
jgi:hypothetical protein